MLNQKPTVSYTARLPADISERLEAEADRSGLTVSDCITLALQARYGLPPDPSVALFAELAEWLATNFSSHDFPAELILIASRHIQNEPRLSALFNAAITGEDDEVDPRRRKLMLQKLGRCVKRAVRGEVFARTLRQPNTGDLVASYSLLRPTRLKEVS